VIPAKGDPKPGDLNKEAAKSAPSFKWHARVAANNALQTQPLEHPMSAFATRLRPHVQAELDISAAAEREGFGDLAFHHLERAHVLAQPATLQHVRVHWRMFRFALRQRLPAEAFGQVLRMLLAGPLTIVGILPTGNTGGSSVNGFTPMPVPADLQRVIDAARGGSDGLAGIDC
jgi:Protein of unknown function (DUF3703)